MIQEGINYLCKQATVSVSSKLNFVHQFGFFNAVSIYWIPVGRWAGPRTNKVFPSFRPSVRRFSWNCSISFFVNFGMVLKTHMLLSVAKKKKEKKNRKWKIKFFEVTPKFGNYFFSVSGLKFSQKSFNYLLYSCPSLISRKIWFLG